MDQKGGASDYRFERVSSIAIYEETSTDGTRDSLTAETPRPLAA